jgi:acetyltransferase-like isoleucine patch superfamily enzyme
MNNGCSINSHLSIKIGDNCMFGERVSLYDHDHVFEGPVDVRESGFRTAPIVIGRNVWLGTNVTVLRGSQIGDNVVIGANVVVKGVIPANTVVTDSARRTSASPEAVARKRKEHIKG